MVKNFTYDTFNRLTAVQYTNTSGGADPFNTPPVSYGYDAGGSGAFALTRLTSITEGPATPTPVNSHTFTYDNLGRITKDAQSIDQKPYNVQYAYNLASQITSITYPSTHVVVQTYDAIGRLCSIGASGSACTAGTRYLSGLTYNAAGEALGLTMGNGVQGNFTYNDHLQLATLRYFKSGQSTDILNLGYDCTSATQQYNNGQIQAMHYFTQPGTEDQTKSESFTYDQLGRLKAAQTLTVNSTAGSKTWSLDWTYDRFGNRLTQHMDAGDPTLPVSQPTLTVNSATNRITNTGYTYDNAGNMTSDSANTYTFDGANRLTKINGTGPAYTYFGPQRIKKVAGSTTTRYIYSGSKVIAEYTGTTNPTLSTEYVYAGSQLLTTIVGNTTTYHHPDHLSNRAESNSSGTRTRTFGQLPFGETWYETGTADKWKFTTYERDSGTGETGLDYANFRFYSSGMARFISPDFLAGHPGEPHSLNRYAYTLGDPVNMVDPLGLMGGPFCWTYWVGELLMESCMPEPSFERDGIDYPDGGGGPISSQRPPACNGVTIGDLLYDTPTKNKRADGTHDTGAEHIYKYHIDGDPVEKSQYTNDVPPTPPALMLPNVIATNAATFDLGDFSQDPKNPKSNITVTYRFPEYPYDIPGTNITIKGLGRMAKKMGGDITPWNTLVLGPDCRFVVTSYPGLPGTGGKNP